MENLQVLQMLPATPFQDPSLQTYSLDRLVPFLSAGNHGRLSKPDMLPWIVSGGIDKEWGFRAHVVMMAAGVFFRISKGKQGSFPCVALIATD